VVVLKTGEEIHQLNAAWRWMLGVGCIFPLAVFLIRIFMNDPKEFERESMTHVKIPYGLVFRYYWVRLAAVMVVWFLYDFSAYAFGIYSSTILDIVQPKGATYATTFGWNTVVNLFYIPGAMLGGPVSDWIGPKYTLIVGVTLQALIGYTMAGCIGTLQDKIAAFCVVYGIFLSFGELGPGDNIGLLASKSCATGVRGQYYGIAAAFGKVGAFVGTYAFPSIQSAGGPPGSNGYLQYPFWVASSLALVSAVVTFFFIPNVGQDTITFEDLQFREYLEGKGWDTSKLGIKLDVERD
jgi:MFS family permease